VLALAVMSVVRRPWTTTLYDAGAAGDATAGEDPTDEAAGSDRSRAIAVTARSPGVAHDETPGASGCARNGVETAVVERVSAAVADGAVAAFSLRATTAGARSLCDAVDVAGASGCARSGVETAVFPVVFTEAEVVCGWLRATTEVERVLPLVAGVVVAVFSLRATTAVDRDVADVVDVAGASGCARSGVETAVVPRAFTAAAVVCGWLCATTAVDRDAVDVVDVVDVDGASGCARSGVETALAEVVVAVFSLPATTFVDCDVLDVVDVVGANGCARSGVETAVVPCALVAATTIV